MADLEFSTTSGQTIARELLIAYLNTGTTSAPVWSAIGKRVEDSTAEMDWSQESKQDILGNTFGSIFDATLTMIVEDPTGAQHVKVVAWYDNEMSFTSQYLRLAKLYGEILNK